MGVAKGSAAARVERRQPRQAGVSDGVASVAAQKLCQRRALMAEAPRPGGGGRGVTGGQGLATARAAVMASLAALLASVATALGTCAA